MSIGLTYLIAVAAILLTSASLYLASNSIVGTSPVEDFVRIFFLVLSYSVLISSSIALIIKVVADSLSAAHFLRKVTDKFFEKSGGFGKYR